MSVMKNIIENNLEFLAVTCGFTRPLSESDSEAFLQALTLATSAVNKEVADSHRDGLCLNTFPFLADELLRALDSMGRE